MITTQFTQCKGMKGETTIEFVYEVERFTFTLALSFDDACQNFWLLLLFCTCTNSTWKWVIYNICRRSPRRASIRLLRYTANSASHRNHYRHRQTSPSLHSLYNNPRPKLSRTDSTLSTRSLCCTQNHSNFLPFRFINTSQYRNRDDKASRRQLSAETRRSYVCVVCSLKIITRRRRLIVAHSMLCILKISYLLHQ